MNTDRKRRKCCRGRRALLLNCEPLESRLLLAAHGHAHRHPHASKVRLNPGLELQEDFDEPVSAAGTIPGPNAPAVSGTIEAANFDTNITTNGGWLFIPPDTDGAVGPTQVMNVVNDTVQWFTKSGTQQVSESLNTFFAAQSPANDSNGAPALFDPKVIYDQYNGRFIVVCLERPDTPQTSRILYAVSDDSDPNGTWYTGAINSKLTISSACWADFPGLGFDANAIYITTNMFTFSGGTFKGTRLWIINKTPFYSGGAPSVNIYDPATAVGAGTNRFGLQPAQMYGTGPSGMGTFLVSAGFSTGSNNELSVIKIANPLSSPTFTETVINLGNIDNTSGIPDAPQLGSTTAIATNDDRIINAVWRNNNLYCANTTNPTSGSQAGQATARWYRISANGSTAPSLADTGVITGEDIATGAYTFFPSVNVDSLGDMAITFAASASTIHPGAYYTGRLAGDAVGTTEPSAVLAAGLDYYVRTFGGTDNRWGDYTSVALDPTDGMTFWPYNEYAIARGTQTTNPTEDGRWGTRWGEFALVTGTISGQTYEDRDDNALIGGSDLTINNVTVFLDTNNNGTLDGGETSVVTSGSGNFSFAGLSLGTYHVREVVPANYIAITPSTGEADVGVSSATTFTQNFGNFPIVYGGSGSSDAYTAQINASVAANVLVTLGAASWTAPLSLVPSLKFNTGAGDDSLVVSYVNGNPMPAGGIFYDGGVGTNDTLTITGSSGPDAVTIGNAFVGPTAGRINLNDPATGTQTVEGVTFNGGVGNDSLTVASAPAAAITFSGGLTSSDQDSLTLNAGSYAFGADANLTTAHLTLNVNNVGTSVMLNASQHINSLNIANALVTLAQNGSRLINTDTLGVTGTGKLDLKDNDLIVNLGTLGTFNGTGVTRSIADGYNHGAWNGNGIVTSESQALALRGRTTLGVALASDALNIGTAATGSWEGETVTGSAVLVKYTYMGDANLSGKVDGDDYAKVDQGFAAHSAASPWASGDFTYDGLVNADDYFWIDQTYSSQGGQL